MTDLSVDERAELNLLRDLRQTVICFGGDDFTIMPWEARHRLHERKNEPYIGCPFCRDKFMLRSDADDLRLRLADVADLTASVATDDDTGEIVNTNTAGLMSALDYALRGSSGCVDPDEWDEGRRKAFARHGVYLGLESA